MSPDIGWALRFRWVVPLIIAVLGFRYVLRIFCVVVIAEDKMGIVTTKWGMKTLPGGALVALNGEAGIQADTLAPGLHLWLRPWQSAVERTPFT